MSEAELVIRLQRVIDFNQTLHEKQHEMANTLSTALVRLDHLEDKVKLLIDRPPAPSVDEKLLFVLSHERFWQITQDPDSGGRRHWALRLGAPDRATSFFGTLDYVIEKAYEELKH